MSGPKLSRKELGRLLEEMDFSDLNTHLGGCTGVAVGIDRVVSNCDGFVMPTDEDGTVIHAFAEVDGALFDAGGMRYEQKSDVVNMVHSYNPFDSERYKPIHFPNRFLDGKEEVDEYLMKEYVATAESENEIAYMNDVADEVEDRVRRKPNELFS